MEQQRKYVRKEKSPGDNFQRETNTLQIKAYLLKNILQKKSGNI